MEPRVARAAPARAPASPQLRKRIVEPVCPRSETASASARRGWMECCVRSGSIAALFAHMVLAAPLGAQDAGLDARVNGLLARMTLEEKVGEMTQLTLQAVSATAASDTSVHTLDRAALETALLDYHVGSILNVWDMAFTVDHWHEVISTIQDVARRRRLPIPVLYGIDAVHGHNYLQGGTLFPQNIAMAATWNPDLVRRANEITAYEVRASGIPWNLSPVLDIGRQPLWSRFFETFGEDPHLASVMGVAAVEGLQGHDIGDPVRVAGTAKHFLGYSIPRTGKDRTTAWIPERRLREEVLPSFAAAIAAGIRTIMVNSGDINGVPVHADRRMLVDLLRTELGFEGVVVSDWEDIIKLHTVHRVAASPREAVAIAVMAGVDMSMVPLQLDFADHLVELVREGVVPESRIDEAVARILDLKYDLGLFDGADPDRSLADGIGSEEFHAVSRRAAEEAITLVKNDAGLLPLARDARILVTGPGATSAAALHGSWTYTWQGTPESVYPAEVVSLLEAMRTEFGAHRVTWVPGAEFHASPNTGAAVRAAADADVAVVVLAEEPSTEKPGDIHDLALSAAQRDLALQIAATGTPVVLVLLANRPRVIRDVAEVAGAVLLGYQPGPHGGEAVANILSGDVNPSGRLPFTYPRHTGDLVTDDHRHSERLDNDNGWTAFRPQWPFGHGLSYTTFTYDDLRVLQPDLGMTDTLRASVDVTNAGLRPGKEVVHLFVSDLYASVAPPVRRLRAFTKIDLAPGERRTVTFAVPVSDLAFVGLDGTWVVEPGDFVAAVGDQRSPFVVHAGEAPIPRTPEAGAADGESAPAGSRLSSRSERR